VIAALGILRVFKSRAIFSILFAGFVLIAVMKNPSDLPLVTDHSEAPRLAIVFLVGTWFYLNRSRIPISIPLALVLVAAIVHWHKVPHMTMIYVPAVAYIVLVLALHPKLYFAPFNRLGDYSYGLYIYAFPTQQLFAYYNHDLTAMPLFYRAFPCVLAVAVLSWHFIERPALKLKPSRVEARNAR